MKNIHWFAACAACVGFATVFSLKTWGYRDRFVSDRWFNGHMESAIITVDSGEKLTVAVAGVESAVSYVWNDDRMSFVHGGQEYLAEVLTVGLTVYGDVGPGGRWYTIYMDKDWAYAPGWFSF